MSARTTCLRGHDQTDPANVMTTDTGSRCLICRRAANRQYMAKATGRMRRTGITAWPTPPMGDIRPIPAEAVAGLDNTAVAACADHLDLFDTDDTWLQARICDGCPLAQWCEQKVAA